MAAIRVRPQNRAMHFPFPLAAAAALFLLAACQSTGDSAPTAPPEDEPTGYTMLVPEGDEVVTREVDTTASGARLNDLDFMVGRWVGEAFGGTVEETWNPLMGGQMLGTFRLVEAGAPIFSEHMLLAVLDGRPVLRLKHFQPDLVGWEEKAGFVEFELLEVEKGRAVYMDGLTFVRDGDELRGYLAMSTPEGPRIERFRFLRVPH